MTSMSSARLNIMMSFSSFGTPKRLQSPPAIESHFGKVADVTFSCVKMSRMSFTGIPRSDW